MSHQLLDIDSQWDGDDEVVMAMMACVGVTTIEACCVILSRQIDKQDTILKDNFIE